MSLNLQYIYFCECSALLDIFLNLITFGSDFDSVFEISSRELS